MGKTIGVMFNEIFGKAISGDIEILKDIKLQGRFSEQNVEDAMDILSTEDINKIYSKNFK